MKQNIEERLIDFSVEIGKLSKMMTKCVFSNHLYRQLIRSASSAPLNYAESQASESIRDFVHKLFIVAKELRESRVNLKIMAKSNHIQDNNMTSLLLDENMQLLKIIAKSIITAKENNPDLFNK